MPLRNCLFIRGPRGTGEPLYFRQELWEAIGLQPNFEQLLQMLRSVAQTTPLEFLRVVMASPEGVVRFLEISEDSHFRTALQSAFHEGLIALGLLGWEVTEATFQAKSMTFPWHKDDEMLTGVFKQLCERGVDSVREQLDTRQFD